MTKNTKKLPSLQRYQVGIDLGRDEGTHIYTMSEKDFLSYLCEVAKGNNPKLIRHTDNEEARLTLKTINK